MSSLLEVSGLRKLFPVGRRAMLHAVDGVDFALMEGESLGIIGESGSGKSTIARLIARLADPTAGKIFFDGREIGAIPARKFAGDRARKSIQLVFQSAGDSLNPAFSAARNIVVGVGSTRLNTRGARPGGVDRWRGGSFARVARSAARINCRAGSRRGSASLAHSCRSLDCWCSTSRRRRSTYPFRRRSSNCRRCPTSSRIEPRLRFSRPRRRASDVRSRNGPVSRPCGRDRTGRRSLERASPSLHARADRFEAGFKTVRPSAGRTDQPHRPPGERMHFCTPMQHGGGGLLDSSP